ncbi:MAG: hypothetical protein LQ344_007605 [Seirophora lacunosa]|nr:MAG: hypothetical protein LQ344_007605 [Seirophora lacunosa]
MKSSCPIYIYAELLPNIGQITVIAALPSDSNDTTAVTLSSDRESLSVAHGGQFANLKLPASVRDGFVPGIDVKSTRNVSLRLPIAHIPNEIDRLELGDALWSASSMTPYTQVACRYCHAPIVKESVETWKDLPSDNWAEMMDFWHCHKPDTDHSPESEHNCFHKGYGAASSIEPTPGVALVDIMCFHLLQADCYVEVNVNPAQESQSIGAASNIDPEQVKLYKWEIRLRKDSSMTWGEHPEQKFISAQLLSMIESQGVRRFVVHDTDTSREDQEDDSTGILVSVASDDHESNKDSAKHK